MGLMGIRRRLLMGAKKVLDTTVKIEHYGYKVPIGNKPFEENSGYGVTYLYNYPKQDYQQTFVSFGVGANNIRIFVGNAYKDYWNWNIVNTRRTVINIGSDGFIIGVKLELIDEAYMYCEETGQIFFAGKNTPYYGYTNINDMPT